METICAPSHANILWTTSKENSFSHYNDIFTNISQVYSRYISYIDRQEKISRTIF